MLSLSLLDVCALPFRFLLPWRLYQGYSIGSASLACFLLFGAFMDEFEEFSGKEFRHVDIAKPEVLIGGLLGVRPCIMTTWYRAKAK